MLLFSATYDQQVMNFASRIVPNNPVIIRLRREEESLDNIKQYYIECTSEEEKYRALCNIYGSISVGQSMIFCHVSTYLHFFVSVCPISSVTKCVGLSSFLSVCLSVAALQRITTLGLYNESEPN